MYCKAWSRVCWCVFHQVRGSCSIAHYCSPGFRCSSQLSSQFSSHALWQTFVFRLTNWGRGVKTGGRESDMKVGGGQNQEDLKPSSLYLIVHGAGSSEVAPLAPEMRGGHFSPGSEEGRVSILTNARNLPRQILIKIFPCLIREPLSPHRLCFK